MSVRGDPPTNGKNCNLDSFYLDLSLKIVLTL